MSTAVGHKGNFIAGELGGKFVLIVADAVGMSVITNEAHDDYAEDYVNDGDDVVKAADAAADTMTALFTRIIERL